MKKTLLTLSILALAACGGGGGDKNNLTSTSTSTSTSNSSGGITGVWDGTENLGTEGVDEIYYVIDSNNLLTVYDYAGDSYDQEGNCYWMAIIQLKALGNNKYTATPLGELAGKDPAEFNITRKNDKLTIEFTDSESLEKESVTMTKSNKSVNNFTPECADSSRTVPSRKANRSAKMRMQ